MTVSSLGAGSGLDLNGLLTSLMQAEQQPLLVMQKKEASYQARISALGSLKGALSSLQTAAQAFIPTSGQSTTEKFATYRATVGDTTLATATATTGAGATSYTLANIVLAKAEQIRKTGFTLPSATDGSADGTLTIKVGTGTAVDVSVKGGSTLADVRDAINASTAGITASIINNGTADYLTLTAKDSGQANQITISSSTANAAPNVWGDFDYSPGTSGTPGTPYTNNSWTEQQEAKSASVEVNGLTITSNSNTISTAISGVTLNLVKDSTTGTTLTVSKDTAGSLTSALTAFVKAYNEAAKSMKDLGFYNADTKTAGALQGDSTLRGAQNQVRNLLQSKAGGTSAYQTLSDLGVALQKDGSLKLDSAKLNKAIESDYEGVSKLVSTLGTTVKDGLESLVGTTGNISSATDSANRMIKELGKRESALLDRLDTIKARYTKQFAALDSLISGMNKTSAYLTQQLANLPGASSNK